MASLNKVLLIGNLTRDPEVRYTPKGTAVADLGLAVSRTYKTESGETKEEVCFVTVVAWGRQAETAGEYLKKGSPIFVEGRLQYETWEKNGEKRNTIKVNAERVQFLSRPPNAEYKEHAGAGTGAKSAAKSGGPAAAAAAEPQGGADLEEDDIPF